MSHCVEFEEKNVEMAVKKACEELNIPREKLKHDVISYGSTGILGWLGLKKHEFALHYRSRPQKSF